MTLTIKMDMDNGAFSENGPEAEVRAVLNRALDRLDRDGLAADETVVLWDTNGNRVGTLIVED